MGKSSGSTRASASNNPRGLAGGETRGELPNTPGYQYGRSEVQTARNEIEDLEYSIRDLEAQKQELFEMTDEIGREMQRDPANEEYYQNRIMELDSEIDAIDREQSMARIRIDRLERQYGLGKIQTRNGLRQK